MQKKVFHEPVLLNEVLEALKLNGKVHLKNKFFIDATLGLGGYTGAILEKGGVVLAIEADSESFEIAKERLEKYINGACPGSEKKEKASNQNTLRAQRRLCLVNNNFRNISEIAKKHGFSEVCGVVFDLGISSFQIESESRGFSFQNKDAPLDMRIDKVNSKVKASDLLNALDESQLEKLFGKVMTHSASRHLGKLVAEKRQVKKFEKVSDFLDLVGERKVERKKISPATLPFLALRIAVNSELENIKEALPKAFDLLKKGGKLVVVSFHSAEDGLVKEIFRRLEQELKGKIVTKKPVVPKEDEVFRNPRSRSAKMRVIEAI